MTGETACAFFLVPLERAKGIEPLSPVWKTDALPLSYTR
jgi:hypothetical protein